VGARLEILDLPAVDVAAFVRSNGARRLATASPFDSKNVGLDMGNPVWRERLSRKAMLRMGRPVSSVR